MKENSSKDLKFGPFTIDPEQRQLFRNGEMVKLPPKAFELLYFLIKHPNEVITKERLLDAVWKDSFVEEANITVHISNLRKCLTDTDSLALNEVKIETIPKVGYRIVLPDPKDDDGRNGQVRHRHIKLAVPFTWSGLPLRMITMSLIAVVIAVMALTSQPIFTSGSPGEKIESIAVIPIRNDTGDAELDYVSGGITEGLVRRLSKLEGLKVKNLGGLTATAFDGDLSTLGKRVAVQSLLQGHLVRNGDGIAVDIQMYDPEKGGEVWAISYDANKWDSANLQQKAFEGVLKRIRPSQYDDAQRRSAKAETNDPMAMTEYLKGRYFWSRRNIDDFKTAIAHYQRAIELDPEFALAYSGLADCYIQLPQWGGADPKVTLPQAQAAILKAFEIDPDLAEAHASLGQITSDPIERENELKRAIKLNPNYASAYQWYAEMLCGMSRFDEARANIQKAMELDPLSRIMRNIYGRIALFQRNYDEAIAIFNNNIVLDPTWGGDHDFLFHAYAAKGMYAEAVEAHVTAFSLFKLISPYEAEELRSSFKLGGWQAFLRTRIKQMEAESRRGYVKPFSMAEFYARAGEKDKAFEQLELAISQKMSGSVYLKHLPSLDTLRSDPRYADLLLRSGLTQ
jgi:DNA-binding winged helix-turn-helix (wHTH) protein/TolB-like protein/Tfp pilus assembly protein PilF